MSGRARAVYASGCSEPSAVLMALPVPRVKVSMITLGRDRRA